MENKKNKTKVIAIIKGVLLFMAHSVDYNDKNHTYTETTVTKITFTQTHQICSLIFFPPNSTVLILKSIPAK